MTKIQFVHLSLYRWRGTGRDQQHGRAASGDHSFSPPTFSLCVCQFVYWTCAAVPPPFYSLCGLPALHSHFSFSSPHESHLVATFCFIFLRVTAGNDLLDQNEIRVAEQPEHPTFLPHKFTTAFSRLPTTASLWNSPNGLSFASSTHPCLLMLFYAHRALLFNLQMNSLVFSLPQKSWSCGS